MPADPISDNFELGDVGTLPFRYGSYKALGIVSRPFGVDLVVIVPAYP